MTTRRSRGQLLVAGTLVLAFLLVSTAMVLNGALFTAHEGQSSSDTVTHDPAVVTAEAGHAVGGATARVNAGNATDYAALSSTLDDVVDGWERQYVRQYVAGGVSVTVSVRHLTRGVRLEDRNASRELVAASGNDDWTLGTDLSEAREGRFALPADGLAATGDPAPFRLVADDGSDTWTVTVTNDTAIDEREVTVAAPSGTATCTTPEGTVDVDIVDGTVDGATCPHLSLPAELGSPYALRVENGSNATGTFTVTAANATALPGGSYDRGGDPTFTPVAHRVTVSVEYLEDGVEYRATRDVTPGDG